MFKWLWRRLGLSSQVRSDSGKYDTVYGYPKDSIAEWLRWNPQLAVDRQVQARLAQSRRDQTAGEPGIR